MHVISYQQGHDDPFVVTNYDAEEDALRSLCAAMVMNGMDSVTLHALDSKGIIVPVGQWVRNSRNGGVTQKRNVGKALPPIPTPKRVTDEDEAEAEAEPDTDEAEEADEEITISPEAEDDEHTYEGYCVKCREQREFHGEVTEMANGRRSAKGKCPVCGTGMNRILKNVPLADDFHTPDDEPVEDEAADEQDDPDLHMEPPTDEADEDEDAESDNPDDDPDAGLHNLIRDSSRKGVRYRCECGEWESAAGWIKAGSAAETRVLAAYSEHAAGDDEDDDEESGITVSIDAPEGTPVEEIAEALEQQADEIAEAEAEVAPVEFSEAEKPAKRAPRTRKTAAATKATTTKAKVTTSKVTDADIEKAKSMKVAKCPQCSKRIPVMERAGLEIFTVHPNADKGLDRCPGSTTTVN